MRGLFDTHSHLQDRAFSDDLDAVIARAEAAGMAGVAVCGYDPESNARTFAICERSPILFPTVGFHPHEADTVTPAMVAELDALAALPETVAVGELGLDFYRNHSTPENQRRVLDEQLGIAARRGLPVCVHSRNAEDAIHPQLAAYAKASPLPAAGRPAGVMHCFGGTLEQARLYVELGFLVSIACAVTYPKNEDARRIARELPLDVLVIETDAPYLPPQRIRGKRNEPAEVVAAAGTIAAERGTSVEAVVAATTANAQRLYGIAVPAGAGAR